MGLVYWTSEGGSPPPGGGVYGEPTWTGGRGSPPRGGGVGAWCYVRIWLVLYRKVVITQIRNLVTPKCRWFRFHLYYKSRRCESLIFHYSQLV